MIVKTLKWVGGINGYLEIIDQRKLPVEFKKIRCVNIRQLYDAIKTLAVRGAPAIGVAGAYGAVLALKKIPYAASAVKLLKKDCEYLASSRPTAVNLRWGIERVLKRVKKWVSENQESRKQDIRISENQEAGKQVIRQTGKQRGALAELRKTVLKEANAICLEDIEMCRAIGRNGAKFVKNGFTVLTHCNAGALATAGQGTALSVLYEAKKQGKRFKVIADESRPLLQGARLTAWELKQAGIDVTVICDDMAGSLMQSGKIDMVIVGADRIAANGDAANKIGTYSLSVLAKSHKIPFYIAAPSSTFDLKTKTGKRIPIEQRPAEEVRFISSPSTRKLAQDKPLTPQGVKIYNPAFDVTPAKNITAIITECGVIVRPDKRKIVRNFTK